MPLVPPILASAIEAEPFFSILKLAPLVYWPMDEASGNLINRGSLASKNAVPTGSPTYRSASIVPANPTGTIELNGTSQYFTVTDAVITGTNPIFSFGVWISTDAGYPGQRTVFQQQDATSSYAGFRLYTSDNTLVFESHHTDGSSQIMTTYGLGFQLSDLTPMYVGLTADATYFTLYINGEQWNRVTRTTQAYVSGSDIFIGRAEGSYRYWEGKISHLFIDNSAMTDQQHFDIWRSGEYQLEPARADNFKDAVTLTVGVTETLDTTGATEDVVHDPRSDPYYGGAVVLHKNVWCKFIPPTTNPYIVTLGDTGENTLRAFVGDSDLDFQVWSDYSSALTLVQPDVGVINNPGDYGPIESGQAFYFMIGLSGADSFSPGPFDITITNFPSPPSNDNFASAHTINVATAGSVLKSTIGSGLQDSQEGVMTGCNLYTTWHKFTADATGSITIDTCDGTLQYQYYTVAVWDATADAIVTVADVDWTAPLAYDSSSGCCGCGEITFAVVNGHVYYVQISQFNLLPDEDYTLSWTDIT